MGDKFARGLLRAAGVAGHSLDLSQGKLGGAWQTTLRVISALIAVLKVLSLSDNNLAVGFVEISAAIAKSSSLTNLNLSRTHLDAEAGNAIAEALKLNTTITSLDVGYNLLGEEATLEIIRVARQHDQMVSLGLANCALGSNTAKEIAEYVQASTVLKKIDLRGGKTDRNLVRLVKDAGSNRTDFELLA